MSDADTGEATTDALPHDIVVLERGWLSSNNVVLLGEDCATLVDSGYCTHAPQTLALVEAALDGRRLETLLNTHLHSDHCGGNASLQSSHRSVRTLIPAGMSAAVTAWDEDRLSYRATGQRCDPFAFDDVVRDGQVLHLGRRDWQVHAAPGHDPHSVVLFEPGSGILISADALWANGFGVVFPELEGDAAFDDVADTLDLIETLRPRWVIPGHGAVFANVDQALLRARTRLARFMSDPSHHATHAAKVLLKFKLLELQSTTHNQLIDWAQATPYLVDVHARHFRDVAFAKWLAQIIDSLVSVGAASRQGDVVAEP